jgi:probable HAF family extracellular repeat protein
MRIQNFFKSLIASSTWRRSDHHRPIAARLHVEALEDRTVPTYSVIELGGLIEGGSSVASDINASAQVVGKAYAGMGYEHAFLWQNGVMTDLGTLGGDFSHALGINDAGQVVGWSSLASDWTAHRAFLLTPEDTNSDGTPDRWFRDSNADGANDLMQNLGTLGGSSPGSHAEDVNNLGQVVGSSWWYPQSGSVNHAFLWQNGVMSDLGTLGGNYSSALAINDTGQIVGMATNNIGEQHAFLRTNGVMTDLGLSYGAVDINNTGQLIDSYFGLPRLWTPTVPNGSTGAFTDLGFLPLLWPPEFSGSESSPLAINNTGQVVGYQKDVFLGGEGGGGGEAFRGILWADGVIEALPVSSATAINDSGQIVSGSRLLTPIPLELPLISISDVEVTEGNSGTTEAVFTVELSAPSNQSATVSFATQNDSAVAGDDYLPAFGTLTFAPGQTSRTISVAIKGDRIGEEIETFLVNLSGPTGAILHRASATGFIYDNEPRVLASSVQVVEGNSATVTAIVTVSLSYAYDEIVAVNYFTSDLSATADSDYVPVSGTLTFVPGGELTQQVAITILGDRVFESDRETLRLGLAVTSDNATILDGGLVHIKDDEPLISFTPSTVTITEGNAGTSDIVFTVSLPAAYEEDVTVDYAAYDGSAEAGSDYLATAGTLRIPAGEISQTIRVPVIGDQIGEFEEYFYIEISNPSSNAAISYAYGFGTVLDDDPPQIGIYDVMVYEGNTGTSNVTFSVGLSFASSQPVTVNYSTVSGTATAVKDYLAKSGTLSIPAGQTTGTITVQIIGDRLAESNETFFVNLSSPTSATIADGQGVGVIVDDEPRISISDASKTEGKKGQTTLFSFTVTLSAAYDRAVTMSFRTVNGTAKAGEDYIAKTGTLTFKPGETTKTITITVKGDSTKEANETFYLDLFGLSGNALFTKFLGVGAILNDD